MEQIVDLALSCIELLALAPIMIRLAMAFLQEPLLDTYGRQLLGATRHLLEWAMTPVLWFMICVHTLHIPLACIHASMDAGSTLQQVFGTCLVCAPTLMFLTLTALCFANDELGHGGVSLQDVVLYCANSLLHALTRPFGFARLVSGRAAGAEITAGEVARTLLGVAFLTFLACGTLAFAG